MSDVVRIKYKHYCVFCGREVSGQFDDWNKYYECNCTVVRHNNKINEEITRLKKRLVTPRYETIKVEKLVVIGEKV